VSALLDEVLTIAEDAGSAIRRVYDGTTADWDVRIKSDASPLTAADLSSHARIIAGLSHLTPCLPIISEEGDHTSTPLPHDAWVVDPLDGTKEFLKRSGEFTVNIARVRDGVPVLGVVLAPMLNQAWIADGASAWHVAGGTRRSIRVTKRAPGAPLRIVASNDHAGPIVSTLLQRHPNAEVLSMGSSLKFCLIADGRADLYLRDGPTMEWDTAAADAVLRAAGGQVMTLDGVPLRYGKSGLRNPHFVAVGHIGETWHTLADEIIAPGERAGEVS
jgi:3'(2'), 5'-bisphosphate nucleotidase